MWNLLLDRCSNSGALTGRSVKLLLWSAVCRNCEGVRAPSVASVLLVGCPLFRCARWFTLIQRLFGDTHHALL